MSSSEEVRVVEVEATFRHSAGWLGSQFLRTIRDEARFLGWRTGARVIVPPKDLGGAGEWVALGPGAVLEAYALTEWLGDVDRVAEDGSCLALVTLDGADTAMLTRLRPAPSVNGLPIGARLVACFKPDRTGAMTDFWFESAP
jgi:hypothetical protein